MESGGWKREKKIERGRLTKKNAEHHADEMTHSDKRTKRGFRHSPEVTQREPRSSLPARMNKRRSGFCWPGVYRGLSSWAFEPSAETEPEQQVRKKSSQNSPENYSVTTWDRSAMNQLVVGQVGRWWKILPSGAKIWSTAELFSCYAVAGVCPSQPSVTWHCDSDCFTTWQAVTETGLNAASSTLQTFCIFRLWLCGILVWPERSRQLLQC